MLADLAKVRSENGDLKNAIPDKNIAVTGLADATADAVRHRAAAKKASAGAWASTARDCAGVLNEAWEAWK